MVGDMGGKEELPSGMGHLELSLRTKVWTTGNAVGTKRGWT